MTCIVLLWISCAIASTSLGKIITVTDNIYNTSVGNSGSGNGSIGCTCDSQHFCECYTLEEALSYLADNDIINVTISSIALSSHTVVKQLHNITIIGHNYPEIDCNCHSLMFKECNNINIKGIKWNGCGYNDIYGYKYCTGYGNVPAYNAYIVYDFSFHSCVNVSLEGCRFLKSDVGVFQTSGNIEISNVQFSGDCNLHYCKKQDGVRAVRSDVYDCVFEMLPRGCYHGLYIQNLMFNHSSKINVFNSTFTQLLVIKIESTGLNILIDHTKFVNNTAFISPDNHGEGMVSIILSTKYTSNISLQNVIFDSNNITEKSLSVIKGNAAVKFIACTFINNIATALVDLQTNITNSDTASIGFYGVQFLSNIGGPSLLLAKHDTGNISVHSLQFVNNTVLFGDGLVVVSVGEGSVITFKALQVNCNTIRKGSIFHFTIKKNSAIPLAPLIGKIDIANITVNSNSGSLYGSVIFISIPDPGLQQHCIRRHYTIESSTFSSLTNISSVICVVGLSYTHDALLIKGCVFLNNDGAALKIASSSLILEEKVVFDNNFAEYGGAVILHSNSTLTIKTNSEVIFSNNKALRYGGAIYCNVSLENACFKNINDVLLVVNDSNTVIKFNKNTAGLGGDSVYLSVPESCIEMFNKSNITSHYFGEYMVTSPTELQLDSPAHLLADSNDSVNPVYIINNIMLGQAIIFPSCALDFNHKPAGSVAFLLRTVDSSPGYLLSSSALYSVACGLNSGDNNLRVTGMKVFTNHTPQITIQLSLYDTVYNWKPFFVQLIIEISPCHSGFYHDTLQEKCVCYTRDNIVSCSGSNATIRRGYWFGVVNDHPTVTVCPLNFCNYADCDISTRTCPLKALPDDQCEGSRSGAACGSCLHGYTLPFDYHECVHVNNCTVGYTAMVVAITCLYWILIIIAVFGLMYFKVGIGYLYSVTFYYSVLDILFGQILQNSKTLHDFVIILSSFARLTPQFLGQFCLVKGLSGIDQQFIHYAHPLAVVLLLLLLSMLTRFSPRLSLFVSKAVIHIICFLLLLSYTSISSTSLLLIKPLTFTGVDKVYTYPSPNLEYFHGRHLMYGLVAILFGLAITIGLPLLLALEPFLNHKINFTRLKPILDQFQVCYKDKYRSFASYHMICRLFILVGMNMNFISNIFITLYLLLSAFTVIWLISATVQPYSCYILNIVDNLILLMMILVMSLQITELSNGFGANTAIVAFVFAVLPLLIVSLSGIVLNKKRLHKCLSYCSRIYKSIEVIETAPQSVEMSNQEYQLTVDDNLRQKCRTIM